MLSNPFIPAPISHYVLRAALLASLAAPGCRSLCKQPVADNVVEARQMSQRGMEALQRGKTEDAEQLFAKAIATCPVDERARCNYADLLWKRGEHAQAVRQMEEAVRLSGGDAGLLVQLGQMQLTRGDVDRARQCAERAVVADRQLPSAWALLGDTQRAAHNDEQALASYHRALSQQELYLPVQLAVAGIYRSQGKPQRALATLAALEDRYSPGQAPAEVLLAQGLALKQLGRYDDASARLTTAIARGATQPDTFYELADAQWQNGDVTNARLALSAALDQAPQHARSLRLSQELHGPGERTARLPQDHR
jgi:tetratricopeptide (TPR) repeat protein